ncbi:MAG TPA: hypothetical protein PK055_07990 [Gammaproteobacteria bacterium]|nr:hypothetical protein [Xanthomonadales bacterium]MCB1595719.1 hypothetical protein [Xanthomonadales bacterium]HOP21959.1 hypothetical protein [Gammaproteobacteria bacterium]HPI95740.1 hypothetical protein [Gammaproteobacteria bacterium]HPQ87583.1 hypothetical protein [Gammaproteobacteria bacterium]
MKKILLALIASISFSSAIATTEVKDNSATEVQQALFLLNKVAKPSFLLQNSSTQNYQQCVQNCLAIYGTWDERGLQRCLTACGVQ